MKANDYDNLYEAFEMAEILLDYDDESVTIETFTRLDKRVNVIFEFNEDKELVSVVSEEIE